MGSSSVRRNLFQNHLSRRPVPSAPGGGAPGLSSQLLQANSSESNPPAFSGSADDGEIVVKDKNGTYNLDIPVLPPVEGEEGDEMEGIEGGGSTTATGAESTGQGEMSGQDKERIEANLVEMMYRSRNRQRSSEPHEILNLIYHSLRNKVAALEEDKWMYEPEADARV
ncbi:hypothetical protein BJY04DRAFT_221845 [Aspergillus karnatakaensis]|uniref:uncharacterized protein n=1 Tax=Aspergillus karnatakaensis TaxID=1810916 RepID=UPI003CCCEB4B